MDASAPPGARKAGAASAGRRWGVINGVGAAAVAVAALAARRAMRARRMTAYVVSGGSGVPGAVTPIRTATNTAGSAITVGIGPTAIAIT
jgi:hypothetical protein